MGKHKHRNEHVIITGNQGSSAFPFTKQQDRLMPSERRGGNFTFSQDECNKLDDEVQKKENHPRLARALADSKEKLAYYLKILETHLYINGLTGGFSNAAQVLVKAHGMGADLTGLLPAIEKMLPEKLESGYECSPFCDCIYLVEKLCAGKNADAQPSPQEAFSLLSRLFDSHTRKSVSGDLSEANQIAGTMSCAMSANKALAAEFFSTPERISSLLKIFNEMDGNEGAPAREGAATLLKSAYNHGSDLSGILPALGGMLGQTEDFSRFKCAQELLMALLASKNEGKPGKDAIWAVIVPVVKQLEITSKYGRLEARETREIGYICALLDAIIMAEDSNKNIRVPSEIFNLVDNKREYNEVAGFGG